MKLSLLLSHSPIFTLTTNYALETLSTMFIPLVVITFSNLLGTVDRPLLKIGSEMYCLCYKKIKVKKTSTFGVY